MRTLDWRRLACTQDLGQTRKRAVRYLRRPQKKVRPSLTLLLRRARQREHQRHRGSFAVDKHSAFEELRLKEAEIETIGRVRQHVNPLSLPYQIKTEAPVWEKVFSNPELPLIVDAGTGYGRFPLLAAKNSTTPVNYLGTEIRRPLIGRARLWAKELGLEDRICFVFANVTISLQTVLEGYPGDIDGIYIQFPDPSFKKKHIKRHIVQPNLVEDCCRLVRPGGLVFMQSDVESCAIYMRNMFDRYGSQHFTTHPLHAFTVPPSCDSMNQELLWRELSWLRENPIGFPTEREVYSEAQGLNIYRMLLVKNGSLD